MHHIGRRRCHPVGESVGQVAVPEAMPACVLMSPPWQQPAELTPFVIHESHTHSGEFNPRCLCKITSSYRDSLLQSGFVCVCVCINSQTMCETWAWLAFSPVRAFVYSSATCDQFLPLRAVVTDVNGLPQDHLMDCGTPAPVGTRCHQGDTVMKHSLPDYCQHITHAVSVVLLP